MQIIDAATIQLIKQKSGLTFQHAKDYAKLSELIEKETEECTFLQYTCYNRVSPALSHGWHGGFIARD